MPGAIAVRLPNWMGDTVMAVPAIRALRSAFPQARVMLVGPWATLLQGQGLAEALVTYPRRWSGRLRMTDTVRTFAPDLAVLLPNSAEAALSAWYWGAPRRVGFGDGGRELLLTDALPIPDPRLHQVDEYLLLAERAGGLVDGRVPHLTPPEAESEARREVRALLDAAGARAGAPLVGVHLGAAYGPAKVWPLPRVIEFCRLADAAGVQVALLGAPADAPAAARVAASAPALDLAGRDRPALVPAVLAEIDALVSGDTGVAHLAAALGTVVVTLFGPTDPVLTAPRGDTAAVVTHAVPCAPCFYRVCPIEHPCLSGVDPAAVLAHLVARVAVRT